MIAAILVSVKAEPSLRILVRFVGLKMVNVDSDLGGALVSKLNGRSKDSDRCGASRGGGEITSASSLTAGNISWPAESISIFTCGINEEAVLNRRV